MPHPSLTQVGSGVAGVADEQATGEVLQYLLEGQAYKIGNV